LYSPDLAPAGTRSGVYGGWTWSFPVVASGQGVMMTPHSLLVLRSENRVGYTSTLSKGLRGLLKG
jgi:hypothetical protein